MSRLQIALSAILALLFAATIAAAEKPNIVLIYADDIGYGDLSSYGATRVETPHLDSLASTGLRFTDAHCSSATCTPSRYAMLTGQPHQPLNRENANPGPPNDWPTMAAVVQHLRGEHRRQ